MCEFASFFHHPKTGEIKVAVLDSHGGTEKTLGLDPKGPWREGHYRPNGQIVCRVMPEDGISANECAQGLRKRFPSFVKFLAWALAETRQTEVYGRNLYLHGLKSARGLVLPKSVGGDLYLRGLSAAEREELMKARRKKLGARNG